MCDTSVFGDRGFPLGAGRGAGGAETGLYLIGQFYWPFPPQHIAHAWHVVRDSIMFADFVADFQGLLPG